MDEKSFQQYNRSVRIQDVLRAAGYERSEGEGTKYEAFVRRSADGTRVRGEKMLVTANGMGCFCPPQQYVYRPVDFIQQHPQLFAGYQPGMKPARMAHIVCQRLLGGQNQDATTSQGQQQGQQADQPARKPFSMEGYGVHRFEPADHQTHRQFYPYFSGRGISLGTQYAFHDHFMLVERAGKSKEGEEARTYTNLAFPLHRPDDLKRDSIAGLEMRGFTKKDGGSTFKGMAPGSDAGGAMWIANLSGKPIDQAQRVLWFESAFDAMAYYQMERKAGAPYSGVYVSTGGNPGKEAMQQLLALTPKAEHRLCFDNDRAGRQFALMFAMTKAGREFSTQMQEDGKLVVKDTTDLPQEHTIDLEAFDFKKATQQLGVAEQQGRARKDMKPYIESMTHRQNMYSGRGELLPADLREKYEREIDLTVAAFCMRVYGMTGDPQYDKLDKETLNARAREAKEDLHESLLAALGQKVGRTVYDPAPAQYKDWNDALLDKPQPGFAQAQEPQIEEEEEEAAELEVDIDESIRYRSPHTYGR